MRAAIKTAIVVACLAALAAPAFAEDDGDRTFVLRERNWDRAESYQLDTTVPEAPAFALLGVDSANAATPQDVSSLGIDLADITTETGDIKPGLAITFAPYWLGVRHQSLTQYRAASRLQRLRARTRISLATAGAGDSDSDAMRAAIGVTLQPFDWTDPRMDQVLAECVLDAGVLPARTISQLAENLVYQRDPSLRPTSSPRPNEPIDTRGDTREDERNTKINAARTELRSAAENGDGDFPEAIAARAAWGRHINACMDAWRERQEKAPNLLVSVGYLAHSEDGSFDNLEGDGLTAWAGYSWAPNLNFGDDLTTRVNIYGRYSQNAAISVDADTQAEADEAVAAISVSMIAPERWEFGVEGAYFNQDFSDATVEDREFSQVSLNAAYRLNDSVWLRGAYGARDNEEDEEFVRLSVVVRQRGRT